jgi:hypothetical protein
MPNHEPPAFRFLTKPEGSDQLQEIGQAWKTSNAKVFSVTLDLEGTGEKIRLIMVPNKPKAVKKGPPPGPQAA